MLKRFALTALIAAALIAWTLPGGRVTAEDELSIGSDAPALDIEHWLQDGEGFFEPVTELEPNKVYVIEFWATWCVPCIANMPHIAELQQQYRGQGVQIVGVSDEDKETVEEFLEQEHPELEQTMAEITSAYSLTTDPDGSTYEDYMAAANQDGIPTAFIVGKQGKIEWIGHPASMDPVLEQVVNDAWDREAYKEEMRLEKEFQENLHKVDRLISTDKIDEALRFITKQREAATKPAMEAQWFSIQNEIKLHFGRVDEEVVKHYTDHLESVAGSPQGVVQFAYWLFGAAQQGAEIERVLGPVLKGLQAELAAADEDTKPLLYNAAAVLTSTTGNFERAIELQQAAIDASADPRQKKRLTPLLKEFQQKAADNEKADE